MSDGPELVWPGKYDDRGTRVEVPPSGATLEALEQIGVGPNVDRLVLGDNLHTLDALLETLAGGVDLIYIDPPFSTGGRFRVSTKVGGSKGGPPATEIHAPAYNDRFSGGATGFLSMLAPRLRRMHALLAPTGSMYVHVDPTVGHMVKLLLDEVFGPGCFQREIVWRIGWISGFKSKAKNWIRNHDLIYFYVKDPKRFTFNKAYVPYPQGYLRRDGKPPTGKGVPIDDVWNANESEFALRGRESLDSIQIKSFSTEKCGYATQKNESIAARIIEASSNPGDLVADFFCGSGTVGVAARRRGRRFVGADCSVAAVHLAKKRLLEVETSSGASAVQVLRARPASSLGAAEYVQRVCEHLGASEETPQPADAVFCGRIDGGMLAVVPQNEALTGALLRTFAERAVAERALAEHPAVASEDARLQVATRRIDLACDWRADLPAGVKVTLLRIRDDFDNDAVAAVEGAAVAELPEVTLALVLEEDSVDRGVLELQRYALPDVQRLPETLRAAPPEGLALVDAWSVTWDPAPLLRTRTDAVFQRTHQRRELPTKTESRSFGSSAGSSAGSSETVLVKLVDVFHQRTILELTIGRRGRGERPAILDARYV